MKNTLMVLPFALACANALAAGIYEIDRSQWEQKPSATGAKAAQPAARTVAAPATSATPTALSADQSTTQSATQSTAKSADSSSSNLDETVVQSADCAPGRVCIDLH